MRIDVNVVYATSVERRGSALDAVHLVAFIDQESGKKCPVLPRHSGNQRDLSHALPSAKFNCADLLGKVMR